LPYEEDPLHILKVLEKEGWLKVLNQHWTSAKVDTAQFEPVVEDPAADDGAGLMRRTLRQL